MYNQQLAKVARQNGFKKTYQSKQDGVVCIRCYEKIMDSGRVVTIQFWNNSYGDSRVCHSHHGCSDTVPTEFNTEEGMLKAIEHESTRTDSKYCPKRGK